MILQWIVTANVSSQVGQEFLVTYWESDEHIEIAPRVDETRWGKPFDAQMIDEEGNPL